MSKDLDMGYETIPELRLEYGANNSAPHDGRAVWGARWIFPDDMVGDRVSIMRDETGKIVGDWDKLKVWLSTPVEKTYEMSKVVKGRIVKKKEKVLTTPIGHAKIEARRLADDYQIEQSDNYDINLFETLQGVIVGNPQRSYGYLYVAGWLR